jgi:hypothetical protein
MAIAKKTDDGTALKHLNTNLFGFVSHVAPTPTSFPNNMMRLYLLAGVLILAALAPVHAQTNSQNAGPIACPSPTSTAPVWGKLVLTGNIVTCYYATGSATPTTWTQIGQPQTINFINDPLLIGLYLTSHNASAISSGTIDNFSITPAPTYRLADYDVGLPNYMGSSNLIGTVWNLMGSGADIWGTSDQCNFQPWLVWGDCTIICRVTSLSTGNIWQKIGIMVRDGFNSGSDYALFCATGGVGVDFQYRHTFINNPDMTEFVSPPAPGITSSVSVGYGLTGSTTYTQRP